MSPMTLPYSALGLRDESLAMERLDGEVIIVDFESGHYYSFQGPAADLLWLIDHGIATEKWPEILASAYTMPDWSAVVDDIRTFIDGLVELTLVTPADSALSTLIDLPDDTGRGEWTAPEMLINDELSDLLVIDPIHDVSDDGWPATPTD